MSTHAHSESTATVYSQMARAASMFSVTLTSFTGGSALATRWMEAGFERPSPGSPQVVKGCTRLEAEVSLLRKRLNSEMTLLPIVKSTDGGGLTCAFMFPAARGSPPQSPSACPTPVAVSHDVPEVDVAEAIDRARTETPQEVDDPEDVEEARVPGFVSDVKHSHVIASPSEDITVPGEVDSNNDWFPSHISVLSEGGRSSDHGWAVGEGVEEVSIPDHHVFDKIEEGEQVDVLEGEDSQPGEQAVEDEELASSIGALVNWSHRAPPPGSVPALEVTDGFYNSTACDSLVYSSVNLRSPIGSPQSTPRYLDDSPQHLSAAVSTRRPPDVQVSSSSDLSSLPGAWQWSTSCQASATHSDGPSAILDDLISLLLDVFLFSVFLLLSLGLLLLLWALSGSTIQPPLATTTSTSGWLCAPDDSPTVLCQRSNSAAMTPFLAYLAKSEVFRGRLWIPEADPPPFNDCYRPRLVAVPAAVHAHDNSVPTTLSHHSLCQVCSTHNASWNATPKRRQVAHVRSASSPNSVANPTSRPSSQLVTAFTTGDPRY
ncbi:uncharacterized protein TRAVEDRAFT_71271 [Trametes versicolor FP-101664 SS1]|uniref:uncharacterized protein n=1 Tax=Trametes versicolor (strain FP-101664) TaxID=717944 RepID=UPI0004622648|nr:uncharacterized protein TRAVEDRAFT_71271 [Trametes versicolor FP-101664 SS1]EIW59073.1 hypothetical protein TRAVEDRAFT_71271 [Trametes versicolor FP-101664 SS1]